MPGQSQKSSIVIINGYIHRKGSEQKPSIYECDPGKDLHDYLRTYQSLNLMPRGIRTWRYPKATVCHNYPSIEMKSAPRGIDKGSRRGGWVSKGRHVFLAGRDIIHLQLLFPFVDTPSVAGT